MLKEGIVYLLIILNVSTHANVIFEHSFRAKVLTIIILSVIKQIWTRMDIFNDEQQNCIKRERNIHTSYFQVNSFAKNPPP